MQNLIWMRFLGAIVNKMLLKARKKRSRKVRKSIA